jgi:rSAM/selenodomain-associated transferase 1
MKPVLQVFAKAPVAGRCKTRLIPVLGAAGAAALHERLVRHRLAAAQTWQQATPGARVELWCAPDTQHPFFADCEKTFDVTLHTQTGPDLGARMWLALCGALARGVRPVLVGTDCPWLIIEDIAAAFTALDNADAVYAPAQDGGYVLVGLARAVPELFANIAWGTSRVMSATRKAAQRAYARTAELRTLPDLDTPADLARLKSDQQFVALLDGLLK